MGRISSSLGALSAVVISGVVLACVPPPATALSPAGTLVQAGPPLTPGRDDVQFGRAVALSADGNVAAIDGRQAGSTWVFARTGTTWALDAVLTPPGRLGTFEATSAAISADGRTVIVGAPVSGAATSAGPGRAWVFTREAAGWVLRSELSPYAASPGSARFGSSVALSADGRVAAVEASTAGSLWVFERQEDTWVAAAELTGRYSPDGGDAAVSAGGDMVFRGTQGYVRSAGGWAPLPVPEGVYGPSAVSGDGARMLAAGGENTVRSLVRTEAGWAEEAALTPSDPSPGARFGSSVAFSADGTVALIGGGTATNVGSAWVFVRDGSGWRQAGVRSYSRELSLGFGIDVALSQDGSSALIGGSESRVWPFAEGATVTGVTPGSGPKGGGTRVVLTGTGFTNVRGVSFGTVPATSFRVISPTELAVVSPPGAAGSVHLTVRSAHAVSGTSKADRFLWRTPVAALGSGGLVLRLADPRQRVSCRRTDCRGTLRLSRGGRLLARAAFSLREGQTARVRLRLTAAGRKARKARPRTGRLVLSLEGAGTVRRAVALR